MNTEFFTLSGVPAVLYGEPAPRVLLCVHGKMGCKEEGEWVARTACPLGWQVLAVDLPEHGARRGRPERLVPWQAVPELRAAMDYGYEVDVVADACATKDLAWNGRVIPAATVQQVFLASLEGVFARIV